MPKSGINSMSLKSFFVETIFVCLSQKLTKGCVIKKFPGLHFF